MNNQSEIIKNTCCVLLSLIVIVAITEVGLRASVYLGGFSGRYGFANYVAEVHGQCGRGKLHELSEDPVLVYKNKAKVKCGNIRTNSFGFRGKDFSATPPNSSTRIAVIGDSETFAEKLPEEQSLPAKIEQLLNKRFSSHNFETINFGVKGYNNTQEIHLLKSQILDFKPDIVILYYVFNDPEQLLSNLVEKQNSPWVSWIKKSYLYLAYERYTYMYFLENKFGISGDELQITSWSFIIPHYIELHQGESFSQVRKQLENTAKLLSENEIEFILAVNPELAGFEDFALYPYEEVHKSLASLSEINNLHVVDPIEKVKNMGHKPHDLWVDPSDPHKNAEVIELVAQSIVDYLAEKNLATN